MPVSYDLSLVILSVIIAILSAYTALDLTERITTAKGNTWIGWLIAGASSMGIGIWSMHFIGMLAFHVTVPISYEESIVFLSVLPAILASGLALWITSRKTVKILSLLGASLLMGAGITTMHYTGMAAMRLPAIAHYDLRLVTLSGGIAIAVSLVALWLIRYLRQQKPVIWWQKIGASALMGFAVPVMHYVGMAAVCFSPLPSLSEQFPPADTSWLASLTSVAAFSILSLSLITSSETKVVDRTGELATANEEIIALNERLKQENLRMGAELDVARQIQMMILPKPEELENIAGLDIAGYMEPADEVGGDYYDVLHTDGVITLGIGDVTGHGLESGILMLMTQTAVRTLQEIREVDPVRFLDTLNRTIYKNVQRMNSEKSLTLAIVNYAEGKISISGQHEETIIVRKGGQIERIDTMDLGFPIGLDAEITDFISHAIFELHPGDGIVLYTDGIPEAKDINKVQYQVDRLCEAIGKSWHKSASDIKDDIIADLRRHIGKQKVFDDITLLVLKRTAEEIDELQQELKTTLTV
ncbi:protein-serine/threonine phosphatase [Nostoc linckia NIES-25]|nr:protein-serine/threonine phosphatase [Nostoc linckia NIES-25]